VVPGRGRLAVSGGRILGQALVIDIAGRLFIGSIQGPHIAGSTGRFISPAFRVSQINPRDDFARGHVSVGRGSNGRLYYDAFLGSSSTGVPDITTGGWIPLGSR
jgi:hypothetical protein